MLNALGQNVSATIDAGSVDALIDSIAIPAFVIDRGHVITHWNKALAKTACLPSEIMIGTNHQWRPFYGEPRPTMADLIIDGTIEGAVEHFYGGKYKPSDVLDGAYVAEDFFPDIGIEGEWLSFTAAPIRNQEGNLVGAIETLVMISDRKKAEMELIEREKRYRELSTIDSLTQLYNLRQFHLELAKELERFRRYQQGFSLCMLDLDHFKRLNDNHGHLFGDKVLEGVGKLISTYLRSVDNAYRYGGEEFVILMPQVDETKAQIGIQRICKELNDLTFETDAGEQIQITASAGLAVVSESDTDKTLLAKADEAMYEAKAKGRNRIQIWSGSETLNGESPSH
ncbi:diguanylate cyclase [Motiliproteus coralliicola]|uniref:diguanylate cyclase n=1 Tax=Motiliproteus coralliicola TaxID=2283196 RepID=A0A369WD48_9GAMM|nr:diguanylate cyclase [Motiliproteus coralliicola]